MNLNYFNQICIYGHPCSGLEYILNIVKSNFSELKECFICYKDVDFVTIDPSVLYVYVQRKFIDVIKELYKIREIFGIDKNISFEDFFKTRYCNMCNCCGSNHLELYQNIDMTPREYWEHHINTWIDVCSDNSNAITIHYERALRNVDYCIENIDKCVECFI